MNAPCRVTADLRRHENLMDKAEREYEAKRPAIEAAKETLIAERLRSADFWREWLEGLSECNAVADKLAVIMGRMKDACEGDEFARDAILGQLHLIEKAAKSHMEQDEAIEEEAERDL